MLNRSEEALLQQVAKWNAAGYVPSFSPLEERVLGHLETKGVVRWTGETWGPTSLGQALLDVDRFTAEMRREQEPKPRHLQLVPRHIEDAIHKELSSEHEGT